jgi:hypothetical protein
MAKVTAARSDDDGDSGAPKANTKATKDKTQKGGEPMDVDEDNQNESGDEEEEEYEIEKILDAKRGSFPEVRAPRHCLTRVALKSCHSHSGKDGVFCQVEGLPRK